MKAIKLGACVVLLSALTACGGTEETTVVHERTVVQPVVTPYYDYGMPLDAVEANCPNGYSNRTRSCY